MNCACCEYPWLCTYFFDGRAASKTASLLTHSGLLLQPPRLLQPVRHALGSVLLRAGKPQQAEQAYREDLAEHPVNGYSVLGLSQSLAAQGKQAEANDLLAKEFKVAWSHADVLLNSSSPSFA